MPKDPREGVMTKRGHGLLNKVFQPLLGWSRLLLKAHVPRDKGERSLKEEIHLPCGRWTPPLARPNLSSLEEGRSQPSLSLLLYMPEVLAVLRQDLIFLSHGAALPLFFLLCTA